MIAQRLSRAALAGLIASTIPLATVSAVSSPSPSASSSPSATAATHLSNLKTKGAAEIARRQTNLQAAYAKLQQSTKLTASDQSALESQITAEENGLTNLGKQLAGETTLAAAQADVQSIINDYRVYVLMLPKTRLVTAADRIEVADANLTVTYGKLQTKLTEGQAAGQNVTVLETDLSDMNKQLTAAQTATSGIVSPLLALIPGDYNTDHSILTGYRTTLGNAAAEIKLARTDAQTIRDAIHGWTKPSPSPQE